MEFPTSISQTEQKFNSGIATIFRLDEIQKRLIVATLNRDYNMQYRLLIAYWKELRPLTKEKERGTYKNSLSKVKKNYKKIEAALLAGKKTVPTAFLESFDDFEMELRDLQQKSGLGMPSKDLRFAMKG